MPLGKNVLITLFWRMKKKSLCREIVSEWKKDRQLHRGVSLRKRGNSMQRDEARPSVILNEITRISAILNTFQKIFHEKICNKDSAWTLNKKCFMERKGLSMRFHRRWDFMRFSKINCLLEEMTVREIEIYTYICIYIILIY